MRKVSLLNDGWFFTKEKQDGFPRERSGDWERITLPHTWNARDGQDGGADYSRGDGYYYKALFVSFVDVERNYFLEIDAAADECTVVVNGNEVVYHKGGYSRFRADIGRELKSGNNEIAIKVNNGNKTDVYPQMADFTFYGGLYRGVKLIEVEKTHFELGYYGSKGIAVESEQGDSGGAILKIDGYINEPQKGDVLRYSLTDSEGMNVAEAYADVFSPSVRMKYLE